MNMLRAPRQTLMAIILASALIMTACGSGSDGVATSTDVVEETVVPTAEATVEAAASDEASADENAESPAPTATETPQADDEPAADTADDAEAATDPASIRAAVVESAMWSDNVTITVGDSTVTFESDGLPSHEYLDVYLADGRDGKYVAGGVESYNARFEFPLVPTLADSPAETGNGAIGVAISGAVFFDPYEGNGSATIANDDNETIDGVPFIDACGGHPLPNSISYHYHGIPFCITDAVDVAGEHSTLIGYLFDGHAIYGPQDVGGEEPTDLDACLGHTGPTPEFADDTYHYHVVSTANYISECLAGVS